MNIENYPKIIYKYRNWIVENNEKATQNHQAALKENKLYLASPSGFNDPFDCRIPSNYLLINTPEKIEKYVDDGIEKFKPDLIALGIDIESARQSEKEELNDIETLQQNRENFEFTKMDKHLGVLSMSARWDSILMWSHYGDFHKGYCIGFNEEKMRNSGLFAKGGLVIYSDKFPIINPLKEINPVEKAFLQTHYKAKDWEYEEEYRLTKLFFHPSNEFRPPENEDRIVPIPDDFIEEVNLGLNILQEHKDEIITICRSRNIKVYQVVKVPFKFLLDRKEI